MTIYSFDVLLSQFGTGLFFHEVWLIYKNLYIVKVYNLKSFGAKYISMTEKAMAPHSSTPVWKIPWTEEPGRLQSIGSLRVRHDWATSLSLFTFMHWRGKWQPPPVFLPGESQEWLSLVGCRLWGCTVGHDWSDLATREFSFNNTINKHFC